MLGAAVASLPDTLLHANATLRARAKEACSLVGIYMHARSSSGRVHVSVWVRMDWNWKQTAVSPKAWLEHTRSDGDVNCAIYSMCKYMTLTI